MTKNVQFKIVINKEYAIKCSYIDSNKKEIIIQLHNKNKQEYQLSSSLIDNRSSFEFGEELFINPHDFKLYDIELYGKEYSVIAEVLFALIINEFKEQIEKNLLLKIQ